MYTFFGQNIAQHCVECSSVVVCMKSNPSIKRVVCSHIFSIQFGKVQQKPCIEKSTLGSSELLQQTSASQARWQAGGKKSFVSIRFSLCFWSLMTPELQGAIINHPCVFLVLPGHPVPFIRGTTSRLGTHRASHHL